MAQKNIIPKASIKSDAKNSLNRKDNTNLSIYSLSLDVKTKLLEFLNRYIVSIPLRLSITSSNIFDNVYVKNNNFRIVVLFSNGYKLL